MCVQEDPEFLLHLLVVEITEVHSVYKFEDLDFEDQVEFKGVVGGGLVGVVVSFGEEVVEVLELEGAFDMSFEDVLALLEIVHQEYHHV